MMNNNEIINDLLKNRGIESKEDIEEFLSEKPQRMYDPFLLLNMEAGVDLIMSAIKQKEKICIYGDYDADGISATTLLLDILGTLTDRLGYYIPSRFDEGYGLNKEAILQISKQQYDLIVTVDCGSVSYDEVEYAKELGMKIVVTDHHSLNEKPVQCILINPKQTKCQYPFKGLAGCGVAFKLAQALTQKGVVDKAALIRVMDLVAIGTIGDIMPLLDENRTFVKYGMRYMKLGQRPGLAGLIEKAVGEKEVLSSDDIAYGIVPHLNAAGRIENASIAVKLLEEKEPEKVQKKVQNLSAINGERKRLQEEAYLQCVEIVEKNYATDRFIVLNCHGVHEGIAGIVAGKIREKYNRPTIITTKTGDYLKGTGRSIDKVNIYEILSRYDNLFLRFGGHAGACGFTIKEKDLEELREKLNKDMVKLEELDDTLYENAIFIDKTLKIGEINYELVDGIEKMEPFGNKNPKPIFKFEYVKVFNERFMGEMQQHVSFQMKQEGCTIKCVLFNKAQEYIELLGKEGISISGTLEKHEWKGTKKIEVFVEKIEA